MDRTRRPAAGLIALALAVCGCDVRDEAVGTAAESAVWPPAAGQSDRGGMGGPRHAAVGYVSDSRSASLRAAAEGRPLLLVFGASWCRWTGELTRGALAKPDVVARTQRFVCAYVDADRDSGTCRAFEVDAFPTVIVIDADGRERFRAAGAAATDGLAAALDAASGPAGAARRIVGNGGPAGDARLAGEDPDVPR